MKPTRGSEFLPARPHVLLTTGEVIRMLRELKGWTQTELANRCGISATNISLLEMAGWKSVRSVSNLWQRLSESIL